MQVIQTMVKGSLFRVLMMGLVLSPVGDMVRVFSDIHSGSGKIVPKCRCFHPVP